MQQQNRGVGPVNGAPLPGEAAPAGLGLAAVHNNAQPAHVQVYMHDIYDITCHVPL